MSSLWWLTTFPFVHRFSWVGVSGRNSGHIFVFGDELMGVQSSNLPNWDPCGFGTWVV
jgi:hypothetical protein